MTVAFISAGYDGTVDETQFAEILHRYSVLGADDFKATTLAGDRIVAISDGIALGPGTRDVATSIPSIQFAAASGTRWDLVALRRDWQPPGGASSIAIIQGGSTKGYPAIGTAATNWNRRPGIMDDQPLYLQEVNGTLLGQQIDLRCWASHSGLFAKDDLVRTYLNRVGAEVNIRGVRWSLTLGANDILEWVASGQSGMLHRTGITGSGGGKVNGEWTFNFEPFPGGVTGVQLTDATFSLSDVVIGKVVSLSNGSARIRSYFGSNGTGPRPHADNFYFHVTGW